MPEQQGWQDIATAETWPMKNADQGTPVLLVDEGGHMFIGVVSERKDGLRGVAHAFVFRVATNWMPLPPPPAS